MVAKQGGPGWWGGLGSSATSLPWLELKGKSYDSLPTSSCGPGATSAASIIDTDDVKADVVFHKLNMRLLPLFWFTVLLSYVDRTNLAFASIQLNQDLGFTPSVYGLGSGLFFATYALMQVPSNLIMRRVGGPVWLSALIAAWGLVASGFAWMTTSSQFYWLRALLGLTEAGAFPGMWFLLGRFYPTDRITFAFAVVESGITLSHTVAAPLAAALLSLDSVGGLRGWQWLFLLEGLPCMVLAAVMMVLLPASPQQAAFLTDSEQRYLVARMHASAAAQGGDHGASAHGSSASSSGGQAGSAGPGVWESLHGAVTNKYVWYLGMAKILRDVAGFGIIFFTPLIVQSLVQGTSLKLQKSGGATPELSTMHGSRHLAWLQEHAGRALLEGAVLEQAGGTVSIPHHHAASHDTGVHAVLLTSLPFALASAGAFWMAHHSQRCGERIWHVGLPYIVCGLTFMLFPMLVSTSTVAAFVVLTVGICGVYSGSAPGLALLSDLAAGPGLVVALPLYNSVGNLGGFIGPYVTGLLLSRTHSFAIPTMMMGACLAAAGSLVLLMPRLLRMSAAQIASCSGSHTANALPIAPGSSTSSSNTSLQGSRARGR